MRDAVQFTLRPTSARMVAVMPSNMRCCWAAHWGPGMPSGLVSGAGGRPGSPTRWKTTGRQFLIPNS